MYLDRLSIRLGPTASKISHTPNFPHLFARRRSPGRCSSVSPISSAVFSATDLLPRTESDHGLPLPPQISNFRAQIGRQPTQIGRFLQGHGRPGRRPREPRGRPTRQPGVLVGRRLPAPARTLGTATWRAPSGGTRVHTRLVDLARHWPGRRRVHRLSSWGMRTAGEQDSRGTDPFLISAAGIIISYLRSVHSNSSCFSFYIVVKMRVGVCSVTSLTRLSS